MYSPQLDPELVIRMYRLKQHLRKSIKKIANELLTKSLPELEEIVYKNHTLIEETELNYYKNFYPEYTLGSLCEAIIVIKKQSSKLDAVTLDYYMKPKQLGGLGYGIKTGGDQNG